MTTGCHIDPETQSSALSADLNRLLEKGLSLARAGHWTRVGRVAEQMEAVATSLVSAGHGGDEISMAQRMRLKDLYDRLIAAVEAQREETRTDLKKLRGVKRAVGAYGEPLGGR